MMKMQRQYVWLIANTYTRWLWKDLAGYMSRRTGLTPLLLVATEQDRNSYLAQYGEPANFDIALLEDPYLHVIENVAEPENLIKVIRAARAYERRFRIGMMRDIVLTDRHLGRGYMPAGAGHPRSPVAESATFERTLKACVNQFAFTERLFDKYPPALVLSYYGGVGIKSKPIAILCRDQGVPFRTLCPARFGDLMYWAEDEYEGNSRLTSLLHEPGEKMTEAEIDEHLARIQPTGFATDKAAVARIQATRRLQYILGQSMRYVAQRMYGKLRGYRKARIGYKLSSIIGMLCRARRHWLLLDRVAVRELPPLESRKIVYFPLQQEPEASTLALSPKHTNQMATVMELSLSLPADAVLAVKEHIWQIGRRPDGFYEALREMPNVLLVHPQASSLDIIRRASVVATISSSAGYEAAALGKKAIFFWERTLLAALPHVQIMSRFEGLERIVDLLEDDGEEAHARRRLDGARYLKNLHRFCMDLAPLAIHGRQVRPTENELAFLTAPLFEELVLDNVA